MNTTVNPVNDAPEAVNDSVVLNEDKSATFNVLGNDFDVDGNPLTIDSFTSPANGNLVQNPDNTFTYTPNANFNGSDSFTYTISDGQGGFDTATVNITVNPVNDAPEAADDIIVNVGEDESATFNVLTTSSDIDGNTLTIDSFTIPANGSLIKNLDNTFTYTPNANFNGSDSFTYTVSDGNGGFDTATVNITVNPVNDAPEAADDSVVIDEDNSATFNDLGND